MANSVSFFIRAIDLTKQAVNSAKAQLGGLAKAFGGSQIGGMLGKGLFVGALALSAKRVAAWAEEIKSASAGAFGEFETRGANSISRVTGYLRALGQEFKNTIVGGLGKTLETLGLSSGDANTGISAEQLDKDTAQRDRIKMLQAEAEGEGAVLELKQDQLAAVIEKQEKDQHNNDLLEDRLKLEKEIAGLKERQASEDAKKMKDVTARKDRYAELALDPSARREAAKGVRAEERKQRKLDLLAQEADERMGRGISFDKLGRSKQLAWLSKHGGEDNISDMDKNIKGLFDTTQKIADALGVGMAE